MASDTEKLRDVLVQSYRNKAKDKIVKDAIKKRIADKKKVKAGGKVDKVTGHNLKHSTLSEEAAAAAKKDQTGAGKDKVGKAKKDAKKKDAKKKNVFGLGQAISNIRKVKNDPRKQ